MTIVKGAENAVEYYLYDCSLPLVERRDHRLLFPSGCALAKWLGVNPKSVYTNEKMKYRLWSPIHEKWFAVRKKN